MYLTVKFVVRFGKETSRKIFSRLRVKQGCTLSLKLFSLYINDIESYLRKRKVSELQLFDKKMSVLLYADDIALLANSRENLQHAIESV